jgi:hypothetical protein
VRFVVLHSLQDHLRIGTHDLDHPISCPCNNTDSWCSRKGYLQHATPLDVLMVPSSSIPITADGERLACGGFSLDEPIHLGNIEFITDYFNGLSLSPRRGNKDAIFVGLTRSGASTPQRAMIEDSTEKFLTALSGEGSFSHPSPRRCRTGAPFACTATTTWKENSLATTMFPPRMVAPRPETNHPSKQHRAHHEGQPMQACAWHPTAKSGMTS